MIKIITIDLDGTLFDKQKNISKENIEAIKYATDKGVKVVISTGRPYNGVIDVLNKLGLNNENNYVSIYNGAKILNCGTKEIIYSSTITGADIRALYQESLRLNTYMHAFRENEELICTEYNPYTEIECVINHIGVKEFDMTTIKDDEKFLKCMFINSKEVLDSILPLIDEHFKNDYSMARSSKVFLEFLNKKADKGQSLIALAKYLNVDIKDTMAIGDAGNDISMIKAAGVGVAMANSFNEVFQYADYITLDNENSGVAHAIYEFIK